MKEKKIAILIKKLALEFDKIAIPALKPYGLTPTQFKVLEYLYTHENVIGLDLQNVFSMTNPTVTGVLQNMENGGWIERVPNTADSRSKNVKLTAKSEKCKSEFYKIGASLEAELTKWLTAKEQDELLSLLNKMMKGMEK